LVSINDFISGFSGQFAQCNHLSPWQLTNDLQAILIKLIRVLDSNYKIADGIAIHRTASVEAGVVLKAPLVIGEHCFIGTHAYLRGGVYLVNSVKIGPG